MKRTASWMLTAAAVIATLMGAAAVARRALQGGDGHSGQPASALRHIQNWRTFATGRGVGGNMSSPTRVIVFSDYRCGVCLRLHRLLQPLMDSGHTRTYVEWRHYPLLSTESMTAALAAECAGGEGKRASMHTVLFDNQDSLGRLSWWRLASQAGLRDSASFDACIANDNTLAVVRADIAAARSLEITGTPLILLDSLRLPGVPNTNLLENYLHLASGPHRSKDSR